MDHRALVHTEDSWDGEPVRARAAVLQPLLEAALWPGSPTLRAQPSGRRRDETRRGCRHQLTKPE
jgi:hypothetical protein